MPDLDDKVAPSAHGPRWFVTQSQAVVLGLPLLFLSPLVGVLALLKPDYVSLLVRDPLGVRMCVGTAAVLLAGAVLYVAGCLLVNRYAAGPSKVAWFLQAGLAAAWVVVGCLPAAFVVMVGPAAIQIQRGLMTDPPANEARNP
ncbi:hypothetical protein [Gemmata sp.]|uniref:hypothetical protein n=1 Tax=Gemmata sp. TaxID=1914242 RepID=UPI003F702FE1